MKNIDKLDLLSKNSLSNMYWFGINCINVIENDIYLADGKL